MPGVWSLCIVHVVGSDAGSGILDPAQDPVPDPAQDPAPDPVPDPAPGRWAVILRVPPQFVQMFFSGFSWMFSSIFMFLFFFQPPSNTLSDMFGQALKHELLQVIHMHTHTHLHRYKMIFGTLYDMIFAKLG